MKTSKSTGKEKVTTGKKVAPGKKKRIISGSVIKINEDEIRKKAREIYLLRIERGEEGSAEKDWLEAEQFLLKK